MIRNSSITHDKNFPLVINNVVSMLYRSNKKKSDLYTEITTGAM